MFMVIISLKQIKSQLLEITSSSEGGKINSVLSGYWDMYAKYNKYGMHVCSLSQCKTCRHL